MLRIAAEKGMTVPELMRKAGTSNDTLAESKARVMGPTTGLVLAIARALEVDPALLLGWQPKPNGVDGDLTMHIGALAQAAAEGGDLVGRLGLVAHVAAHLYVALAAHPVAPSDAGKLIEALLRTLETDLAGEDHGQK